MINELVIHLGDTKTGSTSIQKALVQKAYELPGKSICYPTRNNHIAMAKTLSQARRAGQRETRFRRVAAALSRSDADYGVISAEHFQFVDPQVFAEAIEAYWPDFKDRIRLVAYVRPHPDKLVSAFSERVKLGSAMESFTDFCDTLSEKRAIEYLPRFRKWREVFGSRFTLRPFVREELFREDAVSDFFRVLLQNEDFRIAGGISANTSLTLPQLALLRETHKTFTARLKARDLSRTAEIIEARSAMGRTVSERLRASGLGGNGAKFRIPERLAAGIARRYREDAEALDAEFFAGTPMADALDRIASKTTAAAQSLNAGDHFSQDTVASFQIFAGLLSDMLLDDPKGFMKKAGQTRIMLAAAE
ncbi:hypothetical protein [Cribrihabitans neustonicus]|uniref:hypothetical protein n=1 Tax=Cribrihabitans neustonicus TaxID=1429085 RepID=UPI003B59ED1E